MSEGLIGGGVHRRRIFSLLCEQQTARRSPLEKRTHCSTVHTLENIEHLSSRIQ